TGARSSGDTPSGAKVHLSGVAPCRNAPAPPHRTHTAGGSRAGFRLSKSVLLSQEFPLIAREGAARARARRQRTPRAGIFPRYVPARSPAARRSPPTPTVREKKTCHRVTPVATP